MLNEQDRASAVRSIALVLHVRGPMAPRRVLGLLIDLGLVGDDAEIAIEEAVTSGVLVEVEQGEKVWPGPAALSPPGRHGSSGAEGYGSIGP